MIMFDVSFIVGPQKEVDNILVKSFQNIEVEIQRLRANIISNITALLANLMICEARLQGCYSLQTERKLKALLSIE